MDKDDNSGGNGIKKDANVTVVFRQSAGILNPREVGDYEVWVRVTDGNGNDPNGAADDTEASVFVLARLLADSDDGKRGDELTLVASGVEAKESVTSFRDANGDGIRQATETDLCTVVADGDGTATCTFTISSPPFVLGKGGDCTLPGLSNCNFINFVDSVNRSTTGENGTALDQAAVDRQTFELDPTLQPSPDSTGLGGLVTIFLFDNPPDWLVDRIELSGIDVTPVGLPNTDGSGEVSFAFEVPFAGNGGEPIPLGTHRFEVFTDAGTLEEVSQDSTIEILMPEPPIVSLSLV